MDTPICDFVRDYADTNALRLHMPGHKGIGILGVEHLDITEIRCADSLYEAQGIIQQSENNASHLFGSKTLYSTEGSSQCIRAMLYLVALHAKQGDMKPWILAGRNAHKTFLSAVALLDVDVRWIYPDGVDSYLSCCPDPQALEKMFSDADSLPTAVYLTSPDYLGKIADIRAIAQVCHRHGVLLLVDNAHGAYLRFLRESEHPIDLGADLCCDSAHKTLPVLTGGAYLHIGKHVSQQLVEKARNAMALFGSTSPSYLILQSLDAANRYLCDYPARLQSFISKVLLLKNKMFDHGYSLYGDEPLKITIQTKNYGYTGYMLAELLDNQGVVCEFADPDYLVLMLSPELGDDGLQKLETALLSIPYGDPILSVPPCFFVPQRVLSVREASLSDYEILPVKDCVGRILACTSVGCPPAVPIIACGERIDQNALSCFRYYGIESCCVVK